MRQLLDALKSARRIETLVIIAMLCALLVLGMGGGSVETDLRSDSEARMERILSSICGAGKVRVMLSGDAQNPTGCVISSPGAEDIRVMLQLQRSAQAITGLDLSKIEIVQAAQ